MNKKILIFFSFFLFIGAAAQATTVRYIDKDGKRHVVNTDYGKVPDQYYDQVKEQLEKAQSQPEIDAAQSREAPQTTQKLQDAFRPQPAEITIYVKQDCPACRRLEASLRANNVKFWRYDVERHPVGKAFYREHRSEDLPITVVGNEIFHGMVIMDIMESYRAQSGLPSLLHKSEETKQ